MPTLRLVKGNKIKAAPRDRRGKHLERRYRYPSDEVWQVSEDTWQESRPPSPNALDGFGEAGCGTSGTLTR